MKGITSYTAVAVGIVLAAALIRVPMLVDNTPVAPSVDVGAARANEEQATSSVRIAFAGDMMFDRSIRTRGERHGYDFILAEVAALLRSHDLVVGNLEGPVTSEPSKSAGTGPDEPGNITFTFTPEIPELLARYEVGVVSIGNNHILDFGIEGLETTREHLEAAGISYIGDPADPGMLIRRRIAGREVAFVAYNDFGGSARETLEGIDAGEEQADLVIVFAHWGEEYAPEPPTYVRELAHRFVDAGADLVIGAHPHVVQPVEIYRDARIYYSLGNFVFDQYWEESVRRGLVVSLTIDEDGGLSFEETFVETSPNGQTLLLKKGTR